jgi:hypothetical protein
MPTASSLCIASVFAFTFFLAPVACKSPGQGISSTMQPGNSSSLAETHLVPSLLDVSMARGFSTHDRSPIDRSSSTMQIGNRFAVSVFVLFSSMCEQKVSTYMPSWALLVMTAVCKEVRKKTIELITRIKQKLKGSMSIITKMKNKRKWTNITNVLLDLIDEIQRYTKEKEDLGPFPLQWKALEALN